MELLKLRTSEDSKLSKKLLMKKKMSILKYSSMYKTKSFQILKLNVKKYLNLWI